MNRRRPSQGRTGLTNSNHAWSPPPPGARPARSATASIRLLVANTITVGVTTARTAVTATKTANGGHGAMNVRYENTASAQ